MRFSVHRRWLILLILPWVTVCGLDGSDPVSLGDLGDGMKVLFIGNSLTYANDLPGMVQTVGEAAGHEIAVRSVAKANYSLEDHWLQGGALESIRAADWDVVILQQGPSSLAINQLHLKEWSQKFDTIIRMQGARPALYMVWPEASRPGAFDAVTEAYTKAADTIHGMLFPVGEAWRTAWASDPDLAFYGPDGFHPTELGSALAALVIYQQLFGESPVGLPSLLVPTTKGLPTVSIPPQFNTLLQEAAAQANAEFGRR